MDINVDLLLERIRSGEEWSAFTQEEIDLVIDTWKEQSYKQGYDAGYEAFRSSSEKDLLEAYKERVVESTAAFNELVSTPLTLVVEEVIYES